MICNAGIAGAPSPSDWLKTGDFEKTISVNLLGTIRTALAFKNELRRAKGRLIIVSSVYGTCNMGYNGPYSVSKYGVEALADTLR